MLLSYFQQSLLLTAWNILNNVLSIICDSLSTDIDPAVNMKRFIISLVFWGGAVVFCFEEESQYIVKVELGVWEMARQVTCLPGKPEDLSLDPQQLCKKLGRAVFVCGSSAGEAETGEALWKDNTENN